MAFIAVGEFTAVDQVSDVVVKKKTNMPLALSGFGSATVEIQWFKNGEWLPIKTYTADVADSVVNAKKGDKIRLKCTAFTSGPIKFELG